MLKEIIVKAKPNLRLFIDQAELAWVTVLDSANNGKVINVGGDSFRQLPTRFDSRQKLRNFFRRFWSINFTNRMICNLKTIIFKGRLYVSVGDTGPIPTTVVSLRILKQTSKLLRVRAILSGSDEGNKVISYSIRRNPKNLTIICRTMASVDVRYQPCK